MHLLDFTPGHDALISVYQSHGAYALPLGEGRGEGHVYCIRIEPGGAIGSHEASFGQLFLGGLTAIMIQLTDLAAAPVARAV